MVMQLSQYKRHKRRSQLVLVITLVSSAIAGQPQLSGGTQSPQPSPSTSPSVATTPGGELIGHNWNRLIRLLDRDTTQLATGEIRLDGRSLFMVAAPIINTNGQTQGTAEPIEQRIKAIEQRLINLVRRGNWTPDSLTVTTQTDASAGLPVINVNGNYLMTVTQADAEIQTTDLQTLAKEYAQIVQQALLRSYRERQAAYLERQTVLAIALVLLALAGTLWLSYKKKRLTQQIAEQPAPEPIPPDLLRHLQSTELPTRQWQQRDWRDLQGWLLELSKYGLWGSSAYAILGLYPYSRWLQVVILSGLKGPLQVLGIGLITYLLIRVSFVLINRVLLTLREQDFLVTPASRRLTLRTTTFGRVLKSVAVIALVSVGGLIALATIGVDLVPLLAGAGVIGLAISFASQSLVKDAINGFLILLEDQYGIGDVIVVGDVAGFVEHMNLRITQLRNEEGRLITIPNSAITIVQNLSKDWSRVDLTIEIANSVNPDQALAVIRQVSEEMYTSSEWQAKILDSPEILGIDKINHVGMLIRVWIKTVPLEQWSVAREYRRRLKLALDEHKITIGTPQQAVNYLGPLLPLVAEQSNGHDGHHLVINHASSDSDSNSQSGN